jgi:hypothetical protein
VNFSEPFKIKINKPCNQQWDSMPADGIGRNCKQCSKLIVDFSEMSDTELLNFFKKNPNTHCGRFHNTQLDRSFHPVINKKQPLRRFAKIAAALFAIINCRSHTVKATVKPIAPTVTIAKKRVPQKESVPDKIIINGFVKDATGNPIDKVAIMFDSLPVAISKEDGSFNFEITASNASSHSIYFNHPDFTITVRSYHAAMAATSYNVVMSTPGNGNFTMGIMIMPAIDLPSLVFKKGVIKLTADQKAMLAVVARKLKENPDVAVEIIGYPVMHGIRRFDNHYRIENIKKYLVEKEGISADRIITNLVLEGGDINTIDIKQTDN